MEKIDLSKKALAFLFLLILVTGCMGWKRCKTECLEESIRCTAGSVTAYESFSCLLNKYKCKEECYKNEIAVLKTKLLLRMMANEEENPLA